MASIDEREASTVYDDIRKTRCTGYINNFWRALARDTATLTKEMIYLAISISNGCAYCSVSHGAAAKGKGMTKEMFAELMAIVGMANRTNKLADGYRVPVDERFQNLF